MEDWLGIAGKVVIVTGGSSGIGAAVVRSLLEQGTCVVNADLNPSQDEHENLMFVKTDVTSLADVKNVVAQTKERFGRLDGVVNNAGINIPRLLVDAKEPESQFELSEKVFDKMFAINQKGVYLMSQAVGRELAAQQSGVIINMSSESGLEGSEGQSAYAATKAAVNSYTRSWAKELGKHHVRVVGIAPGIMEETGLRTIEYETALAYTRGITVEKLREGYSSTSTTPLGRSGKLTEVADLVCYLLSDRASYITGVTYNVAGGKTRG
ncbi:SDR family oxidoreductase [Vagococcus lutrae]|uniref:SDR family oxidoreductase n=1 Tax=Vagococcus lutrae TaxID=81947 RepID=A0AAF0BGM4_9ENTE|nr:SDR family oxidoreductase [Vagococcus lutrae]MDT2808583.1 SDR family oxidoreductase [Vagococcus lutrae]MDT2825734.1 SDR family oxidoreductase [Vagococcus lutrae]MDT2842172.1 SDR family oxidoreductase [Vagococcus lutrae]MDY3706409.1 SDR family oxidoreductase [Vagococcus lutrae]QZN88308.1 SDR family oxidoreductase [Vagococcus lutrae]